ncbi:MAG TPA: GatB/YqeY domain-containing protein [Candidatus Acidoferrum sp.]|nr:GatB/YqeY domain-containing protein [Candidatus Acidoferrum sp.]
MTLSEQIQKDIVVAMKSKDELKLSVLRMVKSAIQLKEVEKMRKLDPAESISLLQTMLKQRKESIDQFRKGGRQDLVDKEVKEAAVLEAYLPAGASEAEMDAAITKAIADTGANSMKQMGAVVKAAKEALTGKSVDGKLLSDLVRLKLSKLG